MGFTEEQLDAIQASGRTIVSASAGSGKTTVMIEKIIRLIKKDCDVSQILAVTFTKKAASQMKEKLSKALIEAINDEGCSAENRKRLKTQLSEVASADISTIHSFCAKLLRTHFYVAGVDSGFRVIDGNDAEGKALKNAALDEILEEGYESKEELFSYLLSIYWRKKSDKALRKIFLDVYESLRSRADYREYLKKSEGYDEAVFDSVSRDLKEKLDEKCRYYYELAEDERAVFIDKEELPQVKICEELMQLLEELIYSKDYFEAVKVVKPKFSQNRAPKNGDTAEKAYRRKRLETLKKKILKIVESELPKTKDRKTELEKFLQSGYTAKALSVYLLKFDEKYEKAKLERGVLDYNDLEHKALDLLKNEELVAQLQDKYRYVFVDEYQDVNLVQEELITRLSGKNLFLVGDVKQAIYGFRGSKSRFFVEKQAEFKAAGEEPLFMSSNFRSSDAVLDAVNAQFSLAMTPKTCSIDYARDGRMEAGGRYGAFGGRTLIHFVGKEEKTVNEGRGVYSVMEQAQSGGITESKVARAIRGIIETEIRSKFYDPDKGEERLAKYSDIAILSRKKQGQIAKTVEALSALGIPVTASAAVNVCEFSDVKLLIDILSLLDNAEQDIPLCSALLSPVGDLTVNDLSTIRLAYKGKKPFRAACKAYAEEKKDRISEKLREFYRYFQELRLLSRVLDAAEILNRIITEKRIEASLLTRPNGEAALKRIHRFIEEALTPEPLCVHEFLDKLHDMDYEIEYSENGGENSVKVLTMHASKGLEYPIVIVDNLSAPFKSGERDEVFAEEKYGLAPRAFNGEEMSKTSTVLRRLFELKEAESSLADSLNLYYVALTRAKYALHLIFEEETALPDVKYAHSFADFTDFSVWKKYYAEDDFFTAEKQERDAMVFRPDEALAREIMQAFRWKYPCEGYENLPVKSSATALLSNGTEYADEHYTAYRMDEKTDDTNERKGVAYHAFLEAFDFSSLYDENGVFVEKERLTELVEKELERLNAGGMVEVNLLSCKKLVEILSNPVFAELQGKRLYKEQKFLVALPVKDTYAKKEGTSPVLAKGEEEMIFQGAIDLLAVD
ncbi:MAG: UvrD-helicase domain-containing protein, partial [Clostridia bacterium]|nr:UvrD-helicase domain-containing protein [Clostridia bacterium]